LLHIKDSAQIAASSYRDLLTKLPTGVLRRVYDTIEAKIGEVSQYVGLWLQYQALWDMEIGLVNAKLGDDLERWQQVCVQDQLIITLLISLSLSLSLSLTDSLTDSLARSLAIVGDSSSAKDI